MRKLNILFASIILLAIVVLPLGCSALGGDIDWAEFMSCPNARFESTGDLRWVNFGVTALNTTTFPGDQIAVDILVLNFASAGDDKANILYSSNIRLFMEDATVLNLANASTVDLGDGRVQIPYTTDNGYTYWPGMKVTIAGSTNYDNASASYDDGYDVLTGSNEQYIIINHPTGAYVAETFAGTETINLAGTGIIGPEDYFIAEYVLPSLNAGKSAALSETFIVPVTSNFPNKMPDPSNPWSIGPVSVNYNVFGYIDPQDCIGEAAEVHPNLYDPNFNLNIQVNLGAITVVNPYLPNLQIKFISRTPPAIQQSGGVVRTEWEVINAGFGTADFSGTWGNGNNMDIHIPVFLSEDDSVDTWDPEIDELYWAQLEPFMFLSPNDAPVTANNINWTYGWYYWWMHRNDSPPPPNVTPPVPNCGVSYRDKTGTTDIAGNDAITVEILCYLPYYTFFQNSYTSGAGLTATAREDVGFPNSRDDGLSGYQDMLMIRRGSGSQDASMRDRTSDTYGQGYFMAIYPVIPGSSTLIAKVDAYDMIALGVGEIRESIENDNYSDQGPGSHGDVVSTAASGSGVDFIAKEVNTNILVNGTTRSLKIELKYEASPSTYCSIGWYCSLDDTSHFSDYPLERFWYLLSGTGTINWVSTNGGYLTMSEITVIHTPASLGGFGGMPHVVVAVGDFKIGACMDDIAKVQEPDETNNYKLSGTAVTIP